MEVTKSQLINGIVAYVKSEVIAKIPDKAFRMTLSAGVNLIEAKPEIADAVFVHPILMNKGGMYDIDLFEEVILKTIDEHGDFPVVIPAIKFISPTEKELKFNAEDIRKMKEYIMNRC
jgi:hypothetical protein